MEDSIKDLLKRIIELAYEVNTNTKHHVFCNFSGHVNSLRLDISLNGWKVDKKPDVLKEVYLYDTRDTKNELYKMIETLEKIKKELAINSENDN